MRGIGGFNVYRNDEPPCHTTCRGGEDGRWPSFFVTRAAAQAAAEVHMAQGWVEYEREPDGLAFEWQTQSKWPKPPRVTRAVCTSARDAASRCSALWVVKRFSASAATLSSSTILAGIESAADRDAVLRFWSETPAEADHLHLLIEYPPKYSVSVLVNAFKGTSSRLLRTARPDIARKYLRGVLWSPSYFAASTGGATLETVKRYVEQQRASSSP